MGKRMTESFEHWKQKYAPNDSGEDYDLRGAFDAGMVIGLSRALVKDAFTALH